MRIKVLLRESTRPIEHEAAAAYVEGPLYCVLDTDGNVYKYPILRIWRIVEPQADTGRNSDIFTPGPVTEGSDA